MYAVICREYSISVLGSLFLVVGSLFSVHGSLFLLSGSRFLVLVSLFGNMVPGFRFLIPASLFRVASRFPVAGSWFLVPAPLVPDSVFRGSRSGSWY